MFLNLEINPVLDPKMSPQQFADMLRELKPYFFKIEDLCTELEHGEITVTLTVRDKAVEKMAVHSEKLWLRPKKGHDPSLTV